MKSLGVGRNKVYAGKENKNPIKKDFGLQGDRPMRAKRNGKIITK